MIADYVCKKNVIDEWVKKNTFELFSGNNLKDIDVMYKSLPNTFKIHINGIAELDKKLFLTAIRNLVSDGKQILKKSFIQDSSKLKYFRCLNNNEINKSRSVTDIEKISNIMPFKINSYKLVDEWKLLRFETLPNNLTRIDHFWSYVFELKTTFEKSKFSIISKLVKASLTLSYGSAEVECEFSVSSNILTDDKAAMSCRMLNSWLNIQDGLFSFNKKPQLESKKKAKEEKNKRIIEKELEEKRKEEEKQLLASKENIDNLEKQLSSVKKVEAKQKEAADKFLEFKR